MNDIRASEREALLAELLEALKAVVRIADRKTVEFDAARAAIAKAQRFAGMVHGGGAIGSSVEPL